MRKKPANSAAIRFCLWNHHKPEEKWWRVQFSACCKLTKASACSGVADKALGTVLDFAGNPLSMWQNGNLDDKRLVLKLAFAKPITYDKEAGLGTAVTSLPFTVFQGCDGQKGKMVVEVGFEPTNS